MLQGSVCHGGDSIRSMKKLAMLWPQSEKRSMNAYCCSVPYTVQNPWQEGAAHSEQVFPPQIRSSRAFPTSRCPSPRWLQSPTDWQQTPTTTLTYLACTYLDSLPHIHGGKDSSRLFGNDSTFKEECLFLTFTSGGFLWFFLFSIVLLEEEISNMRKELEKYGIQMPAFSKIGGILANELSVDEAACKLSWYPCLSLACSLPICTCWL